VERFDAQGVSYTNKSQGGSTSNSSSSSKPIDAWVTVTPKKRMRVRSPNVMRAGSQNVIPPGVTGAIATSTPANPDLCSPRVAPIIPEGVILANPSPTGCSDLDSAMNHDPLDAFHGASLDGMKEEENVDMFLNLQKIDDIDMSTNSSKHKRCEDGEEVTFHDSNP